MLAVYPKVKLWLVDKKGEPVFGEGLALLLEAVDKYGSLSSASDHLGMSYRYALHRVSLAEKRLGFNIVKRSRGGVFGGRSELTPEGRELLSRFKEMELQLEKFLKAYKSFYQGP